MPPIFCTATETVAYLANADLCCNTKNLLHRIDDTAEDIVREEPPNLQPSLAGLKRNPYLRWANAELAACVDIFVNNFIVLA